MSEQEAIACKQRRALAYPAGWFQVGYSDDVAPCEVKAIRYFGQPLVLFRTEGGKPQVLDAFCAHLGAHLGVGGKVAGERIACAFHAWEYGIDGACKRIPYNDVIPKRGASVRAWPTAERSGIIMIWHSPEDGEPAWDPPELPEFGQADWGEYFVRWNRQVATTGHEIVENIVDTVHGAYVHGATTIPVATHRFEDHRMIARFENDLPSVGHKAINHVISHGLGMVENRSEGAGEKAFFAAYTPIDEDNVDVWFSMLARKSSANDPTGELSRKSARATIGEFEKDIPIWEAKLFRKNPLIVMNDGPFAQYRTWAQRFF
jgi:phenylpropionate dioxygenase-like ring-hydroxylating dioxygenase large terminal subunit